MPTQDSIVPHDYTIYILIGIECLFVLIKKMSRLLCKPLRREGVER